MRARGAAAMLAAGGMVAALGVAAPAAAAECRRAVVLTLPGITWADVAAADVPHLEAAVRDGATGSMAVRTIASTTGPASGFATIGAGARVEGGRSTGGPVYGSDVDSASDSDVEVAGMDEMREALDEADYSTVLPGALASAMTPNVLVAIGNSDIAMQPPVPEGYGRWALLAATDTEGKVALAATGSELLRVDTRAPFGVSSDPGAMRAAVDEAFAVSCASMIVDPGDLDRHDRYLKLTGEDLDPPLGPVDDLLGYLRSQMTDEDLLLVVSPTSPLADDDVHFGVAIAVGAGFPAGSTLSSPSTRREGIVSLPDVAPTVLEHLGHARPASMLGRAWTASPGPPDPIAAAIDLDEEAVYIDRVRTPISTGFVLVQILLYALAVLLLRRAGPNRALDADSKAARRLEIGCLIVATFPLVTYLAAVVEADEFGTGPYLALLSAMDVVIVALAWAAARRPLDRLLVIVGATTMVFLVDLAIGAPLQLNTVFSYSPLVAGRFAGIGNIAFAVLAAATVLTGALVVHRWGRRPAVLGAVGVLFALAVVMDGGPSYGSDVGGALALVPGLGFTLLLLSGRRLTWRAAGIAVIVTAVVLTAFLMFDLTRPEAARTHLARLYENVRDGGIEVFWDTIGRKVSTQMRVARSTIWTFVVPPALGAIAWLLLRPQGRWERLSETYPALRAGLIGGLLLAVLGFAVNDSGIVVPAMMFSYLVPVAFLAHLSMERGVEVAPDERS